MLWVTNCFNSGTIQWSPLKKLRVLESLLNSQACYFSRFFTGFWFLKTSWKVSFCIHLFKVDTVDTRIMYQICSKLTIKKLGWRYWPRPGVFMLLTLNVFHTLFWRFHGWLWRSKCQIRGEGSWYLWQNLRTTNF